MYSTNALCIAIVLHTRDSLWQPVCAVTLFVICYVYTATTQPHIRAEKLRTKFDSTMYHQWTKDVFTFGDLPLKETFLYGLKAKYRQGYIKPLLLSIFLEWPKHLHILDCPKYFRGNKILFISIFVYGNYFNFHTHKKSGYSHRSIVRPSLLLLRKVCQQDNFRDSQPQQQGLHYL